MLHGLAPLRTENLDQTIELLRRMHWQIAAAFQHFLSAARAPSVDARKAYLEARLPSLPLPPARVISFEEYQAQCRKVGIAGVNVKAAFAKQLLQLKSFSGRKASAVMAVYPTPAR